MSPTALGGTSHSRASSVNGGRPIESISANTANGMEGAKGGNRAYPHLDDLVSVRPDVDINQPIRTILQMGELLAKQADTHLDFRRPDIAIQEYIKASIVAIEIIPRHKEYVMLQSGKGELHRLYTGLNKRINSQHAKFAEVKFLIKENNAKSGVKAVGRGGVVESKPNGVNGHTRAQSVQHPPLNYSSNGVAPRQKPPIQPKPDALHGNVLPQPTQSTGIPDLAARLAGLRSGSNGVVQDPRIRTQSIPGISDLSTAIGTPPVNYTAANQPSGPREMPSVPTTAPGTSKPPLDVQIPSFPRAPDAIYSPAQNADTPAAANLLSSVPRSGSYLGNSRQGAAPPISSHVPTPKSQDNKNDYFSPAHSRQGSTYLQQKKSTPTISDSAAVSAEDLMTYLGFGSHTLKVLVVDVRSREEFESGHILTQSIICVEPITLRAGISAEQLGDSMIIAPDSEQALYEQRHDFDVIVYYDQDSTSIQARATAGSDDTLLHFSKAISDYDYEKRLKRRPMILLGGLDAWTDLLGPNSLKASISRTSSPAPDALSNQKAGRPLGRVPPARKAPSVPLRRRKTHSSRPLTREEETKWDETLRADSAHWNASEAERANSAELVYAKTTEDFFRRYPELPAIQESMVTPPPADKYHTFPDTVAPVMPPPPARPAPALPRQRSSGLSERGPTMVTSPAYTTGITSPRVTNGLTGLHNPMVTCYMNSAIQAISATTFLRDLFLKFQQSEHPVPRKPGEHTNPPQLLVRSFSLLMGHLWSGTADFLKPISFAKYVNSVHAGSITDPRVRNCAYGGTQRQHDSAEFLNFALEILDDELNPQRHRPEPKTNDSKYENALNQGSFADAAALAWNTWSAREKSPISHNLKGLTGHVSTCTNCHKESRTFELFTYLNLTVPSDRAKYSITQLIAEDFGKRTTIDEYTCVHCKGKHSAIRTDILCYLPDYLILELNRYTSGLEKSANPVTFPERGLELPSSSCFSHNVHGADRRRVGPFKYDTYAVTLHRGKTIAGGHYFTIARSLDKPTSDVGRWHKFNDTIVTPVGFQETQGPDATIIFLKRQ